MNNNKITIETAVQAEQILTIKKDLKKIENENTKAHDTLFDKVKDVDDKVQDLRKDLLHLPQELAKEFKAQFANKETEKTVGRIFWGFIATAIGIISFLIRAIWEKIFT